MVNVKKIDRDAKIELLINTFGLSLLIVLTLNTFISVLFIKDIINKSNFDGITLSFQDGYFLINEAKMGVSLIYNILGIVVIWFALLLLTLKSIKRNLSYIL